MSYAVVIISSIDGIVDPASSYTFVCESKNEAIVLAKDYFESRIIPIYCNGFEKEKCTISESLTAYSANTTAGDKLLSSNIIITEVIMPQKKSDKVIERSYHVGG